MAPRALEKQIGHYGSFAGFPGRDKKVFEKQNMGCVCFSLSGTLDTWRQIRCEIDVEYTKGPSDELGEGILSHGGAITA